MMAMKFSFPAAKAVRSAAAPVRRYAGYFALAATLTACTQGSDEDLLDRARLAMNDGDVRAAEIDVRSALQQSPDHAEGRRLLGEISLHQQDPVAAVEQFERSLAAEENAEARILYARALLAAGRGQQFLQLVSQGEFTSVEDHPQFLAILARGQADEGQLQRGRESLAAALATAPDDPMVITTNAFFLLFLSDSADEAQAILEEAVQQHPDYADAWSMLGGIQQVRRQFAEAETSYERVLELNANRFPDRLNLITVRIDQGKTEEANAALQRLLANNREHPGLNYLHGRMLVEAGNNEEAITALLTVLNAVPDHAGSLYLSAVANIAQGNLNTARGHLDRLLASQRDHVQGHLLMANLNLLMEDPGSAEQVARGILRDDPSNYAALGLLATALNAQGQNNSTETMQLYQRMAEVRPQAIEPRWALGAALLQTGDTAGGVAQFQAARDLVPESAPARERLIQALLATGDVAGAKAEAEAYAEQQPENPRPPLYLARFAMQENDPEAARGHFADAEALLRQATEAEPDNLELKGLLIDAMMGQGKLEEVGSMMAELPEEVATLPVVLVARGRIALAGNRAGEAETLLRRAFNDSPESTTLLFLSGAVAAQGREDEAISLLNDWLADNPDDAFVRNELASTLMRLDREQEATEQYQLVLESGPDNVIVLNNLAWLLREQDPQQALNLIERARELAPGSPQIMDTHAMILLASGATQEALALNQETLDLAPDAPDFLYHRAMILRADGQREQAVGILERMIEAENTPDSQKADARTLLAELQGL